MTTSGPLGWQPDAFVAHVQDVLGELNRRHDRRLVLRAFVDLPPGGTAADSDIAPRVAWRPPLGQPTEALGQARLCPLTALRWQHDAPHPGDLARLQDWLAQHPLLTDAVLVCGFPERHGQDVIVALRLWLPRLWLTMLPDGRAEVGLVLLGEDDPALVLSEVRQLLAAVRPAHVNAQALAPKDEPAPQELATIGRLVDAMRAGQAQKVVWSRELLLPGTCQRSTLAARMRAARPEAWTVDVQLPDGQNILCATPELLVTCRGDQLTTMALAGTGSVAQLTADDARLGDEHGRVRDFMCERLAALGVTELELRADIGQAGPLAHRRTHITGRRMARIDALTVALTLHPTPALLGLPREKALELLEFSESPRGLYGGCLGRLACDGSGDGEAVALLRGVSERNGQWHARAGAGLVPQSVPADEAAEIAAKIAAIVQSIAPGPP